MTNAPPKFINHGIYTYQIHSMSKNVQKKDYKPLYLAAASTILIGVVSYDIYQEHGYKKNVINKALDEAGLQDRVKHELENKPDNTFIKIAKEIKKGTQKVISKIPGEN